MAWTETCKIDFQKQVEHKKEQGYKTKDALVELSKDSGIPIGTLKNWLYPEQTKRRIDKQQEKNRINATFDRNELSNDNPTQDKELEGSNLNLNQEFKEIDKAAYEQKLEIVKEIKETQQEEHEVANKQFRTSFTGDNEWYTPIKYVDAAREVMGTIDLDPATSEFGQSRVCADKYYTKNNKDGGLYKGWHGNVWLNPPYSQPDIGHFIGELVSEFGIGNVKQAVLLTHNYTDTAWFHQAESVASLICFTSGRVKFEKEDGTIAAPTQGSAFFYFGENKEVFREVFGNYGFIR